MIQEIFPDIYMAEIETEMVGVRHLNYNFLRGAVGERSVLIDYDFPGKVDPSCGTTLREVMRTLNLRPDGLDVLITHGHKDHLGQARALTAKGARIFVNPGDMGQGAILSTLLTDETGRRQLFRLVDLGTHNRETCEAFWQVADCFSEGYEGVWDFPYLPVRPGDCRQVGDYRLEITTLPRCTRGGLDFSTRAQKFIFSGDHILGEVAPIVSNIGEFPNALSSCIASLGETAARLSNCLFMPGHGASFRNPHTAVEKTIHYYHRHCENLCHIVRTAEKPFLLRDIGAMIYRRYRRPLTEKEHEVCIQIWFKTYTCLKYLGERGALREEIKEGASYWRGLQ